MSKRARGRKPLDPENRNSELLHVRVQPRVRRALEGLAKKHKLTVSNEMQLAFEYWIKRSRVRERHIEAIGHLAAEVAEYVESTTKQHWTDDLFTASAVQYGIKRLFGYLAPGAAAPSIEQLAETVANLPDTSSPEGLGQLACDLVVSSILLAGALDSSKTESDFKMRDLLEYMGFGKIFRNVSAASKLLFEFKKLDERPARSRVG